MSIRGLERAVRQLAWIALVLLLCGLPLLAQEGDQPAIEEEPAASAADAELGLEWVDISGVDPAEVSEALETLVGFFTEGVDTPQFFVIRSSDKVAVYGTQQQRVVAREVLSNLTPAGDLARSTRVLRLAPDADQNALAAIAQLPGMAEWEVAGQLVILRGTARQVAASEANLLRAGLVRREGEPTCATVRLYYLRDAAGLRTLLEEVPESLRGDAVVQASSDTTGRQMLVLTGSPDSVRNLRRIIATLDVPQPEVRLDIWAFQISGGDATDVAERAALAQERIALVSGLIRGYLRQLEGLAQDQMAHNLELLNQLQQMVSEVERAKEENPGAAEAAAGALRAEVARMGLASLGTQHLLTPSARGRHPLSLTETLAALLTTPAGAVVDAGPAEEGVAATDRLSALSDLGPLLDAIGAASGEPSQVPAGALALALGQRLDRWLLQVAASDPRAVSAWAEMVAADPGSSDGPLAQVLAALRRSLQEGRVPGKLMERGVLVPRRLLHTMADPTFSRTAAASISDFLELRQRLDQDWSSVSAEQLRLRAADAQTVLQTAERALAEDVSRLFLRPLESELRRLANKGGQAGLGSTSRTSISVLSGSEANVVGSAISYFEVSRSPELTPEALYRSEEFSRALSGLMPPRSQRDPVRQVVRVELAADKVSGEELAQWPERLQTILPGLQAWTEGAGRKAIMMVGTSAEISSAVNILRASGAVKDIGSVPSGVQAAVEGAPGAGTPLQVAAAGGPEDFAEAANLPAGRLLALAMELGRKQEVWAALTEGAQLTFTPSILPGGSAAEVAIEFTVSHDDAATSEGSAVPLSRVAQHTARTSVYVQALDLFALSSFSLQTTHPRPDRSVPILGQLPIIGQIFRFPRSPATVHHESVLMVYSTILPTGGDLAELLDSNQVPQ